MTGCTLFFGGDERVYLGTPLDEVQRLVQNGIHRRALIQFEAPDGRTLVINPMQINSIRPGDYVPDPQPQAE